MHNLYAYTRNLECFGKLHIHDATGRRHAQPLLVADYDILILYNCYPMLFFTYFTI